jgi:hypothetical protein
VAQQQAEQQHYAAQQGELYAHPEEAHYATHADYHAEYAAQHGDPQQLYAAAAAGTEQQQQHATGYEQDAAAYAQQAAERHAATAGAEHYDPQQAYEHQQAAAEGYEHHQQHAEQPAAEGYHHSQQHHQESLRLADLGAPPEGPEEGDVAAAHYMLTGVFAEHAPEAGVEHGQDHPAAAAAQEGPPAELAAGQEGGQ